MKKLSPSKLLILTLVWFCAGTTASENRESQRLTFDLNEFSFEELKYETCKIYRHRSRTGDRSYTLQSLELSPENMGGFLISRMCDLAPNYSGTPRQLKNLRHYDYKFVDGQHRYIPKSGFRELDFVSDAEAFMRDFHSLLPICDEGKTRHLCFGAGIVRNGFYLGEWISDKPHGQGIQLLTRRAPWGFNSRVWNSIYRGAFKDGMFHGRGKFVNLTQSFEGNWFRGERHGYIDWRWPENFDFGFTFIRHNSGIVVADVSPFSPAESAGLQVGDIILTITHGSKIVRTDEVGVMSIKRFLNEINAYDEISIKTLSEESNDHLPITFSKSQGSQKDRASMFCIASRDEKCYEKSSLKNVFIDGGKTSRGSYHMGMEHAYTQDDLHISPQADLSARFTLFCYGHKSPNLVLTRNPKLLENIKFVTPSVFIFDTGYNTPCTALKIFPYNMNSFSFPHLLKGNNESLELLSDLSGLYKVDIIDIVDDFIRQLDAGRSPRNIKSSAHDWCNYERLHIYCGHSSPDEPYVIHQQVKIIDNPESAAHQRWGEMQLLRAKENYLILSVCRATYIEYGDNVDTRSMFKTCAMGYINARLSFWRCVYLGQSMSQCSNITNSVSPRGVDLFEVANPEALDGVDLNDWIFGDV